MIEIKRAYFCSFFSVLLSGIVFIPGSVENCIDKKYFRCKGQRAWYCNGFICYLLNTTTREVIVNFSKPPEHYGFKEFEVTLKNSVAGQKQKVYIAEYDHTFTNVISGVYQIWVMPYEGRQYCSQCKTIATENFTVEFATGDPVTNDQFAKSTTSEDSVSKVDIQRITTDESVHVTKEQVTKSTTGENSLAEAHTQQTTETHVQIAAGVGGSVLCVGLVVAILFLCCRYRKRPAGDANDNHTSRETDVGIDSTVTMEQVKKGVYLNNHNGDANDNHTSRETDVDIDSTVTMELVKKGVYLNNNNVEKIKLQRRPKLFVLYEEDHCLHREVVDSFTLYLQNYCHCHVMSGYLHLDTTWVHQDIQEADYVIIVNSKSAFGIYKSLLNKNKGHAGNLGYTENGSSGNDIELGINCILQKFLQQPSYDKIVMVYFDYTNESYIIPEICSGYNYKLMKNFIELLLYIHKLKRTDNLAQYDLPLDGKYYSKPVGKDLQNAIRNAAAYERENPDGFIYTYSNLWSVSSASDDSGFDSGFQQEPVPHYFLSSHFQIHMDSVSQDGITLTPSVLTECRKTTNPGPYIYTCQAIKYHENQFALESESQRNYIAFTFTETPIAADSCVQFDFIPPDDDVSEFETASVSQSEQMMNINARYSRAEDEIKGTFGNKT